MILVHDIFVCKPGNASKLAKLFKEWSDILPKKNGSVMTDMTGQFHRVIMATTYESLTEYDEEMKNMGKNMSEAEKAMMDKFADMNDMYVSGSREVYKVW